jgi:hypothetical protein
MTPQEIRKHLGSCDTEADLELTLADMRVPDVKHIVDTFTAFKELAELTMRDEYIIMRARVAYDKMVGNLR